MPDLETQLTSLAEFIEWPAVGDLRLPIHGEAAGIARRGGRGLRQSRWALAAAAVILIVATLVAYTPTREAVAAWLNLHVTIHRTQNLPTPSPLPSGPAGERLGLGTQTTLDGAQRQVGWNVVVPFSLGAPDEVYVKLPPSGPSGGEVTLVYVSRTDIRPTGITGVSVLVTEARGQVNEQYFGKVLGPDVNIEKVSVNGHAGWWISGKPHDFAFTDAQGNFYSDTLRLATNTLIFDDGGTLVRIEGDMTEAQALEIARSLT
jgi:hypothetical protein